MILNDLQFDSKVGNERPQISHEYFSGGSNWYQRIRCGGYTKQSFGMFFYCYVFSTASCRLSFYGRWKTRLCFASYEVLSSSSFQPLFLSISRFAVWFARTFHGLSFHFSRVMNQSISCKIFICIKKKDSIYNRT